MVKNYIKLFFLFVVAYAGNNSLVYAQVEDTIYMYHHAPEDTCIQYPVSEQDVIIQNELPFANHLIKTGQFEAANYFLGKLSEKTQTINTELSDTLNYLRGWSYYNRKMLHSSATYLSKVSINSGMYHKSHFFAAYNLAFLGSISQSKELLTEMAIPDKHTEQLRNLQFAGISLLERDYESFDNYSENFEYSYFPIAKEEHVLMDCYGSMVNFNQKSMFTAGMLSTIVPGLGKIYTGKVGEGVTSFLAIGILGAITAENYLKAGLTNYKTIVFGSLFTVFYIGNIYGSIFSVKLYREEFYKTYENRILFNMHIPLRTIFN